MGNAKCCVSGCTNRPILRVTKKGDLSHREAKYCNDCSEPYRCSEEGKKYFNTELIAKARE